MNSSLVHFLTYSKISWNRTRSTSHTRLLTGMTGLILRYYLTSTNWVSAHLPSPSLACGVHICTFIHFSLTPGPIGLYIVPHNVCILSVDFPSFFYSCWAGAIFLFTNPFCNFFTYCLLFLWSIISMYPKPKQRVFLRIWVFAMETTNSTKVVSMC